MTASEWLRSLEAACKRHFPNSPLRYEITRETRVKARLEIDPSMFADFFFREETGRIDYALIVNGQRQYGLDNLGGWHEHPIEDPDSHVPIDAPSPNGAIERVSEAARQMSGS